MTNLAQYAIEGYKVNAVDYIIKPISYFDFKARISSLSNDINSKHKEKVLIQTDGKKIVVISDIHFKGKRNINWEEVEQYLKEYIGDCYEVVETSDQVYIGSDFPGELKGSGDTKRLYGANAKAKANDTQGIPMLLQCATNKRWQENFKGKHNVDAKFGWYRFTTRFALPVYNNDTGDLERFNIFRIEMLIRHAADGNLYLYDMVNIKKETSTPLEQ